LTRVLILIRTLWPGSFTRIAIEEAAGLRGVGLEPRVIAFSRAYGSYAFEDLIASSNVPVAVEAFRPGLTALLRVAYRLLIPAIRDPDSAVPIVELLWWGLRARKQADVLYCEDQFVGGAAKLHKFMTGTPYVVLGAEPVGSREGVRLTRIGSTRIFGALAHAIIHRLEATGFGGGSALTFVSRRSRRLILNEHPVLENKPTVILPPGCHPTESIGGLREPRSYAIAVSKWDLGRNPEFGPLVAGRAGVDLIMAGAWSNSRTESGFRQSLASSNQFGLSQIRITGAVAESELGRLLDGAIAYLHWNSEGFAMGVLEAMARGVPPICTSEAGVAELLTDGKDAVVIDTSSVEAFAKALAQMSTDRKWRETIAQGAIETARKNSWARHNSKLAELLTEVAEHSPPAASA
jgi:glycosyltransferase involved in cell wall biosynthesis